MTLCPLMGEDSDPASDNSGILELNERTNEILLRSQRAPPSLPLFFKAERCNFNRIYWFSLIASGPTLEELSGFIWPCFRAAAAAFKALFCFFSF